MKVSKDGKVISILDLFEKDFVLLYGSEGHLWKSAADALVEAFPFPLESYRVAPDGDLIDIEGSWYTYYDMTVSGALLVRPDGHVAWRSKSLVGDPKMVLAGVCEAILIRAPKNN